MPASATHDVRALYAPFFINAATRPTCLRRWQSLGRSPLGLSRYRGTSVRLSYEDVKTEPTRYCGRVRSGTPHVEFRPECTGVLSHDLLFDPMLTRREVILLGLVFLLSLPAVTTRFYASDEIEYFAWLRSLSFDRDADFQNEYQHFYDA